MPEIPTYLFQKALPRPSRGGGGGAPGLPAVPDVSGLYRATAGVGQEVSDLGATLGALAARKQKARDVATLTAFSTGFHEDVAAAGDQITSDARLDPWEHGDRVKAARDQLFEQRAKTLPAHLRAQAKAKAYASTEAYVIRTNAEGTKAGLKRASDAYELRMDQTREQWHRETDPAQRARIEEEQRQLTASYVESGLFSQVEGAQRLLGVRQKAATVESQLAIRRDPDGMLRRLQAGEFPDVPAEARATLIDDAQRERSQQFQWAEAQEAKTARETAEQQRANAEAYLVRARNRQLSFAQLDAGFRTRDLSPEGHRLVQSYLETRAREDRAEGRAAESLRLQRAEAGYRETEAQLSVRAMTGWTQEQILAFATDKKLPARAIDGAMQKAHERERAMQSQWGTRHTQAEQLLRSHFYKDAFSLFLNMREENYRDALNELTERSQAYRTGPQDRGHSEDPLAIAEEIGQKHRRPALTDLRQRLEQMNGLVEYPSAEALRAAEPTLPPWKFKQQLRYIKDREDALAEYKRLHPDPVPQVEDTRGFWERKLPRFLGGTAAPTTPAPEPEKKAFGYRKGIRVEGGRIVEEQP